MCSIPQWKFFVVRVIIDEDVSDTLFDDVVLIVQIESLNCVTRDHFEVCILASDLIEAHGDVHGKGLLIKITAEGFYEILDHLGPGGDLS